MQPPAQPMIRDRHERRIADHRSGSASEVWRLTPFQLRHAASIARWVKNEQQLRWLAPSTPPPLTAQKVVEWKKVGGEAFVLVNGGGEAPLGYGEVNPMRKSGEHLWLGHVIVRPDRRGQGLGGFLLRALLAEAFDRRNAKCVALIVFPDNLAALRCYGRAGFKMSGEEHHQFRGSGPAHRLLRLEIARPAGRAAGAALPDQGSVRTAL